MAMTRLMLPSNPRTGGGTSLDKRKSGLQLAVGSGDGAG